MKDSILNSREIDIVCEKCGKEAKIFNIWQKKGTGDICDTCADQQHESEAEEARELAANLPEVAPCIQHPDESARKNPHGDERIGHYLPCDRCRLDNNASIPPIFKSRPATLATYRTDTAATSEAATRVRGWLRMNPKGFLTLHGGVGLGKTHLAIAALVSRNGGIYISFSDMMRRIRASYNNGGDDGGIVQRAKEAPCILIDDLREIGGRDVGNLLFDVVDHRYSHQKATILTSNLTPDQLAKFVGDPVADRIADTVTVISLTGESWRRKG